MASARVLITDDDDMTLEMLQASLAGHYQVSLARSGCEALALAAREAFDLVVLDVDMPEMDGYATCTALKAEARTADVPVIFLSALVNIEERLRGYRVGGADYLTKPFDVKELITKIDLAARQRASQRMLNSQIQEAMHTAQATAHLYDEAGAVLGLQRQLGQCGNYTDIANAFFKALAQLGFEGCLRLSGRQGVMSRSGQGECSALGHSILDYLEQRDTPAIQAVGDNTSFHYGNVLMLVRNLPVNPSQSQCPRDEADRLARVRDNVALMAEGIVSRMKAMDVEMEKSSFAHSQKLVAAMRQALADISARQQANRLHLGDVFQRLHSEVEQSFIHLGLSESQEEHLSNTMRRHIAEAMGLFDQGKQIESQLDALIGRLT